jgi:uncharacterized protein (DUF433 family)
MSEHIIIPINYIERKPSSGQYRIVHKGITVTFLATLIDDPEWTVERICENYNLTPAEVHAAWAFYYDHKAEVDHYIALASSQLPNEADLAKRAELEARYFAKTGKHYSEITED